MTKPDLCLEKMALAAMERMDCRGQVQEAVQVMDGDDLFGMVAVERERSERFEM